MSSYNNVFRFKLLIYFNLVVFNFCSERIEVSDSFIKNEVDDFEEWLKEKAHNDEIIAVGDSFKSNLKQQNNRVEILSRENGKFSQDQNPLSTGDHFERSQDRNHLFIDGYSGVSQERNAPANGYFGFSQDRNLPANDHSGLSQDQNLPSFDYSGLSQDQNLPPFDHSGLSQDRNLPTFDYSGLSQDRNLPAFDYSGLSRDQNLPANDHFGLPLLRNHLFINRYSDSQEQNAPVKGHSGFLQDKNLIDQNNFFVNNKLDFVKNVEKNSDDERFAEYISGNTFSNQQVESENNNPDSHEELFFYRRGKADKDDPLPKLFKALTQHKENGRRNRVPRHTTVATCPIINSPPNEQLCSRGSKYAIRQFNSSKYSEKLYAEMSRKQPRSDDFMCSYTNFGSVNERAICPYVWNISKRNPDRLPEFLFEAKCSCQISRNITSFHQTVCVELEVKIPVLWRTECYENSYKYQEGWDNIVVACVPLLFTATNPKLANNVNIEGSQK